jgi:hypothetical protein
MKKNNLITQACAKKLDEIYAGINGTDIGIDEFQDLLAQGAAPSYGEILYSAMEGLMQKLKPKPDNVFYDLGSGVGKFPMWVNLTTDIKKSVGIEISPTRYKMTMKAVKRFEKAGLRNDDKELLFVRGDIAKVDFNDATIIFISSSCFSERLMGILSDKFRALNHEALVISLKKFPEDDPYLALTHEVNLATQWCDSLPFYFYKSLPWNAFYTDPTLA